MTSSYEGSNSGYANKVKKLLNDKQTSKYGGINRR